jgi:hypothetical protein
VNKDFNIALHSHEWKRSKNGRMEQSQAMEYGSRKALSDVINPRNIYIALINFDIYNIDRYLKCKYTTVKYDRILEFYAHI